MVLSLGIDPDTFTTGLAVVSRDSRSGLVVVEHAALASVDEKRNVSSRVPDMGRALESELRRVALRWPVGRVIVEGQVKYTTGPNSRVSSNSLIPLAQVAGLAAGVALSVLKGPALLIPRPQEWKGQVPKPVHQRRILDSVGMTQKELSSRFDIPKKGASHVIDAIGLALWGTRAAAR